MCAAGMQMLGSTDARYGIYEWEELVKIAVGGRGNASDQVDRL